MVYEQVEYFSVNTILLLNSINILNKTFIDTIVILVYIKYLINNCNVKKK